MKYKSVLDLSEQIKSSLDKHFNIDVLMVSNISIHEDIGPYRKTVIKVSFATQFLVARAYLDFDMNLLNQHEYSRLIS